MDTANYQKWKESRYRSYPENVQELFVEIGGLKNVSDTEIAEIKRVCRCSNMAIYKCRDHYVDRAAICSFTSKFGLTRPDHHLCASTDGISEVTAASDGSRSAYVPYSSSSLSWHTDGYYNEAQRQVKSVVLHCVDNAATGGENALLDPEIAYIALRDEDPRFITAFEHPQCMTIPANTGVRGEIRPAVCGPVFSYDVRGNILMRYSARKKNIQWRDDEITRAAREFLSEILADKNGPVFHYCLQPGEGLISNNVLHNRSEFQDGTGQKRLLYRARYLDRLALNEEQGL